ncbi:MAG: RecQ family ATP-dependent DNA helicase, partial [Sulfurimonas sp.]|nr:RecQ family ATP-dependent DNA helicase [Sulfurimonas sp.]
MNAEKKDITFNDYCKNINIIFCDIEASKTTNKIHELGFIYKDRELRTSSISQSIDFISSIKSDFIAGHNFINFDLEKLKDTSLSNYLEKYNIIDTLPLSLLLFNEKTHHSLPKNYKSEDDFKNNPVEDSIITLKLFMKLEDKFKSLESDTQNLFYSLLKDELYFKGFFIYIIKSLKLSILKKINIYDLILDTHQKRVVNKDYLKELIESNPVELVYILALLTPHIEIKSHPPKVLFDYPNIVNIQKKLCFDIDIANDNLSEFSKEVFGFDEFNEFPRLNASILDNPTISQREIVEASLRDDSFLCILPTGGGKTFTFWLPAIYKSSSYKSLTVVISPLQALIEDHIKSFNANVANYKAVAISGFLSPLERSEAIEFVINGEADILYIAPESLRSNSIFGILKNRLIERFVIDEVHCLSTWGNDFRQDYYYICEYIKELIEAKPFQDSIPISCFTATAKPSVIDDIEKFFLDGLDIKLDKYFAVPERKNLTYKSIESQSKNKYKDLLQILNEHDGSTLIYIPSSTKECDKIAEQLSLDTEKNVKSFHSKIESGEKMNILKEYLEDKIDIIVATTAFGMGVDKSNIMNVIHYEVSDSLESYAQEAGRGARNKDLNAYCPILFDENDLDKHFISLNRSKLTASEINSILRVIKKSKNNVVNKTAFELAKEAGWDVEDSSLDYSTKVKTVLLELEREKYISRKRNKTNFFADSIASNCMEEFHKNLNNSSYNSEEKQKMTLVLQSIIGRGKIKSIQVDELAYILGYEKHDISLSINQLKEMDILGNSKDLSLEIDKTAVHEFKKVQTIELLLFDYMDSLMNSQISMRELNEYLHSKKVITKNSIELIKSIIKNWKDKSNFMFKRTNREQNLWYFKFENSSNIKELIFTKHTIANKLIAIFTDNIEVKKKETIEFSLKDLYDKLDKKISIKEIDKTLLYLHHLKILELLNGRFISYSPMSIYKGEKASGNKKYTLVEYKNRLAEHYKTKIESIHIMGEYAKRLQNDDYKAILFLKDYFTLPYDKFKKQYNLLKEQLSQPITKKRFKKLFEEMSDEQREIIEDKKTKAMMILAGPGSGKTKVLVHKIASLILTEDIKPEQFMMLTFSKTARWEFKSRLNNLIGALSYDIEIQTFHSFALKLIARVAKNSDEDILNKAIEEATKQINDGDIALPHITVLVLDEFQDVNENSFELIKAIYKASNEELKIIAVGDDDQCINEHAGASVTYIDKFREEFAQNEENEMSFKQYELLCNFRSNTDIVEYSNDFAGMIKKRYKTHKLYANSSKRGSVEVHSFPYAQSLVPAVIDLIKQEEIYENIAILTYTNDEVMQIYSLLIENGIEAKYIIEREKFELKNIVELVEFCHVLNSFLLDENSYKEKYFNDALKII